jgi:hypothetical protein
MNLLTLILRLPFLPVQAVVELGEVIRDQAEQELHDPAAVRRQMEEAERARASGALSGEEVARIEEEALGRLIPAASRGGGVAHDDGVGLVD